MSNENELLAETASVLERVHVIVCGESELLLHGQLAASAPEVGSDPAAPDNTLTPAGSG
jgi:hypothetical protein